ncbi:MAG: diguanylate cyclase [Lachnospiraceae bacterium]|nr:diguanylate cyclase [Lachnospiraceae bacterium]
MGKIWEWYENLNEIVYVSDIENHNLVYMNKKALEVFGFSSVEEIKGRKCHEVFRKRSMPCQDCNNHELKEGEFSERQNWNNVTLKTYSLKDTLIEDEGKKYRVELAFDMTLMTEQDNLLKEYKKNEDMINQALKIAMGESTPVASLERLIQFLGSNLEAERMYIFEEQEDGTVSNTYEWCTENTISEKENLQNVPFEAVSYWYNEFARGNNVIIPDLERIRKKHPLTYEYLKPQNIRTLIVNPIMDKDRIIGFYGVDNAPAEKLVNISKLLTIVGYFITSALKRVILLKKLEAMSYYDSLTGFKNRYALDEYICSIDKGECLGVVYTDITGLKKVNDSMGHKAGDRLIKRACKCMNEYFGKYERFRIGGDEFCIICRNIEEDELEKQIEAMRSGMSRQQALMAVGYIWVEHYEKNFESLLSLSDSLMYRDKRDYYSNPGRNRRYKREEEEDKG